MENIDRIYDLLNNITITNNNEENINEIKHLLAIGNYFEALKKMRELKNEEDKKEEKEVVQENKQEDNIKYPKQLGNQDLEEIYIGMLLENPKLIVKYYLCFEHLSLFSSPS